MALMPSDDASRSQLVNMNSSLGRCSAVSPIPAVSFQLYLANDTTTAQL